MYLEETTDGEDFPEEVEFDSEEAILTFFNAFADVIGGEE